MSPRSIGFRLVGRPAAVLAGLSLAACSTAMPPGGTSAAHWSSVMSAKPRMSASGCGKSVVYVTSYNNSIYIYDQKHNAATPCGQITGVTNPQGLFVDKKRNLWVAISGNCKTQFSSVLEFKPGDPSPIETLQDPAGSATDVAIDNKSGTVYVTNFLTTRKAVQAATTVPWRSIPSAARRQRRR